MTARQLPGGVFIDGELRRDFEFLEITGALELALGDTRSPDHNHPQRVTQVLCQTLAHLGYRHVDNKVVRCLSIGDRQFLMRQLAAYIDDKPLWLAATCRHCEEHFDVCFRQSELPVKTANNQFPECTLNTSIGTVIVRVPTGADQEIIAQCQTDEEALWILLARIVSVVSEQGEASVNQSIEKLTSGDIDAIERKVESMCPEVVDRLISNCPYCDGENYLAVSPYTCMEHSVDEVLLDVHTLASHYHWDEATILTLSRRRRHTYLQMIDRNRGMQTAATIIE